MKMNTEILMLPLFVLAVVSVNPAFSQTEGDRPIGGESIGVGSMGVTLEQAESIAKFYFSDDLKAGKLTAREAGALFKCANDRYAEKLFSDRALAKTMSEGMSVIIEQREKGEKLNEADKKHYGDAYKKAFQLQKEEEDKCRKTLNIKPSVKRVFEIPGAKEK